MPPPDVKGLVTTKGSGGSSGPEADDDIDIMDMSELAGEGGGAAGGTAANAVPNAPTDDSQNPDNQTLLRLLETGEKVGHPLYHRRGASHITQRMYSERAKRLW